MIIAEKVFSRFEPGTPGRSLPDLCRALLLQQQQAWPMCREGIASLAAVETREVAAAGWSALLQFNPRRIVSTGAKVDAASIGARPCFLCQQNLPAEQKGILYGNDIMILCNPAPIFHQHFTIPLVEHRPQEIDPYIETMLGMARDLAPAFTLFYNGPKCGASAPDHFHFQAAPANAISVERDAGVVKRRKLLRQDGHVSLWTLDLYGRTVCVLESRDDGELASSLRTFLRAWGDVLRTTEEPMMNLLASAHDDVFQIILFLRRKHRPDAYFREGEERLLNSPAAVDIGGVVVTPVEKDFRSVTGETIEGIFREVCEEPSILRKIVERM